MAKTRTTAMYSKLREENEEPTWRRRGPASVSPLDVDSDEDDEELTEREQAKKKWVKRLNIVWRKLNAAFWVGAACLVIYWTNFFRVIWEHPRVNYTYFYLALGCLGFNVFVLFYLAIWCEVVQRINEPWDVYCPKAIPAMAIVGIATFFFFFFALYPVWGILTLLIQFTFFMGYLNAGHFLPGGVIGSLLMFVILIGAFFTSHYIPHEGFAHYKN